MATGRANLIRSNAEYARCFEGMRGISARSNSADGGKRFQLLENMYVDYEGGADAVESIPGFRRLFSLDGRINGIYLQRVSPGKEYLVIHAGKNLYRIDKALADGGKPTLSGVTVNDTKSTAFSFGDELYIMDGSHMIKADRNGVFHTFGEGGFTPYIPTVRRNGEMLEDRNLLTDLARESYLVRDPCLYSYGTPELRYKITDEKSKTCCVIDGYSLSGSIYIPSYATIDSIRYQVTEIAPRAFLGNRNIRELFIAPNLKTIGESAFENCVNLEFVVLPYTIETVGERAFSGCTVMRQVNFDRFPLELCANCFSGCPDLWQVVCLGDISNYSEVTAGSGIENVPPQITEYTSPPSLGFNVYGMFCSIEKVTVGGLVYPSYYDMENSLVRVDFTNPREYLGQEVVIHGILNPSVLIEYEEDGGFLSTEIGAVHGGYAAILGCRISESLDGRVFLSGNPDLPGTVFYSGKDRSGTSRPTYFGVRDYFIDGVTADTVTDLLALHGELAVFKSADDGSGTIFYHKANDLTNGRSVYPISYVHGSIPVYGGAVSFFDEPLFLTDRGVCALEKVSGSEYREVKCRSNSITSLLLREDMSAAEITEWLGYLVISFGERIYLADSRDTYNDGGILQYEWYRLNGIGTYKDDRRLYRYSTMPLDGYELSDEPDGEATGTVYSEERDGMTVYFVWDGDKKLRVYPTEELVGGSFYPCSAVISDGRLLFFGTEGGDICVFNNDKRGIAPDGLASEEGFDAEKYKKVMGSRIHPSFYSFASHRANYGVLTAFDDCDIPYLTKNSVRDSLVIKFKTFSDCIVSVGTETDLGIKPKVNVPLSRLSFDRVDFSSLTSSVADFVTVTVPESERGWTEKRYSIYSDGFCSPFGVYSISYRYKIKGKIKE